MSKSLLEQVPDRMLFTLVKKVFDSVDDPDNLEDIDYASQKHLLIMGITTLQYIDATYVMELIKLNRDDFENGEMTQPLKRPTFNTYMFPYSVYETQTVRTDFEMELESYSSDTEDIIQLKNFINSMGDFNEWDNEVTKDTEVIDSEYSNTYWYKNEIYKVK